MPRTEVWFYQDRRGSVPVLDWLRELRRKNSRAYAKCRARIELLAEFGHELRRPHTDMVAEGVYELRARARRVQCRILYFFHGKGVAVLVHGLFKEGRIDAAEIERALRRRQQFDSDPDAHAHVEVTE